MEIKELLTEITQTEDVRARLSNLRSQIKEDKKAVENYVDAAFIGRLEDLLSHVDAKTRKNATLLLGDLSDRVQALDLAGQVTQALWAAYEREDTKFVLASYIKGLSAYDCGEILESLRAERKRLGAEEIWEEDKKHMRLLLEQMDLLLEAYGQKETYRYQGIHKKHALILTTDPYMKEALLAQVQDLGYTDARLVGRGVRLLTDSLDKLSQIRIYREMLFVIRFRSQTLAAEGNLGAGDRTFRTPASFGGGLQAKRKNILLPCGCRWMLTAKRPTTCLCHRGRQSGKTDQPSKGCGHRTFAETKEGWDLCGLCQSLRAGGQAFYLSKTSFADFHGTGRGGRDGGADPPISKGRSTCDRSFLRSGHTFDRTYAGRQDARRLWH